MPPEFDRNRKDAENVSGYIEFGGKDSEQYEEVIVAVHPGFCMNGQEYTSVDNLRPEDYLRHTIEMHRELEDAVENGVPVDVVYRSDMENEAFQYLGDIAEEVDSFYESSYGSGFITSEPGRQGLAETFSKVEDGGKLSLYGELNGLCFSQFQDLAREVEQNLEKDVEVVEERPFPEDRVDRTQGVLHWEDEMPAYIQALEFNSLYR